MSSTELAGKIRRDIQAFFVRAPDNCVKRQQLEFLLDSGGRIPQALRDLYLRELDAMTRPVSEDNQDLLLLRPEFTVQQQRPMPQQQRQALLPPHSPVTAFVERPSVVGVTKQPASRRVLLPFTIANLPKAASKKQISVTPMEMNKAASVITAVTSALPNTTTAAIQRQQTPAAQPTQPSSSMKKKQSTSPVGPALTPKPTPVKSTATVPSAKRKHSTATADKQSPTTAEAAPPATKQQRVPTPVVAVTKIASTSSSNQQATSTSTTTTTEPTTFNYDQLTILPGTSIRILIYRAQPFVWAEDLCRLAFNIEHVSAEHLNHLRDYVAVSKKVDALAVEGIAFDGQAGRPLFLGTPSSAVKSTQFYSAEVLFFLCVQIAQTDLLPTNGASARVPSLDVQQVLRVSKLIMRHGLLMQVGLSAFTLL
jgi:hypothetical protein